MNASLFATVPLLRHLERALAFVLILFYVGALGQWLGWFFGLVVGVVTAPGALLLPLIYWLVEDEWLTRWYYPWLYGTFVVVSCSRWGLERRVAP